MIFSGWAFRNYEREPTSILSSSLDKIASRQQATDQSRQKSHPLKRALSNKVTLYGCAFIFAYQGGEVAISGWVITFLEERRGGGANVGYVTSGFWAGKFFNMRIFIFTLRSIVGITLGRFCLSHAAKMVGEKKFVYILGAGAIAFQLLVWLIPNLIGDAIAVAFLGFWLGDIYPCASTVLTRLLPMEIQMTAYSFIASAGSSGGALAPFMTGLLAQAVSNTSVLHPICIGLFSVMLACWFALPAIEKISD